MMDGRFKNDPMSGEEKDPSRQIQPVVFRVPLRSASGRERQFVAFGCSRSAGILCRAMVATRERPLSLSLTFSAA